MPNWKRFIYEKLKSELDNDKVSIIFGARQTGKSHLMHQLYKEAKDSMYFDLEQPETLAQFAGDDIYIRDLLVNSGKVIFIDEFHYIKNISHIFKSIYDLGKRHPKKKVKIFATGSSAIEMHKHLKESMAGRTKRFYLRPLTFEEYKHNKLGEPDEYFIYGGLPETYSLEKKDRPELHNEIISAYIQKDIKSLINETNISAFNKLVFILASLEQAIPINNLAKELSLSSATVQSYIDILEQTFVLHSLHSYSTNQSNELKKSKKYYFYDLGIRNSLLKNYQVIDKRSDRGIIYETYVMQYLVSIIDKSITDLFFWRTTKKDEVDFIWKSNQVTIPIEVKTKISKGDIPSGIKKFFTAYPASPFAVVVYAKSLDIEDLEQVDYKGKQIHYINIKELEYIKELLQNL